MSDNRNENRKDLVLIGCVSVFIGSLLISAITASKLYELSISSFVIAVPVGTSLFALTFISTDVISEIWGARRAAVLVLFGFVMRLFSIAFLYFAVNIEPAAFYKDQEAYKLILSSSSNILWAGIITYPISQLADIYIFHKLKELQIGKNLLWFRNTASTFISQAIDSIVFVGVAFGAILPFSILMNIVIGQLLIKWLIAICDTPFVYIIRNFVHGRKWNDFSG